MGAPAVALEHARLVADAADLAEHHASPVAIETEGVDEHRALDEVGLRRGGEELGAERELEVPAADAECLGETQLHVRVLEVVGALDRVLRPLAAGVDVHLEGQPLPPALHADTDPPQLGGPGVGRLPVPVGAQVLLDVTGEAQFNVAAGRGQLERLRAPAIRARLGGGLRAGCERNDRGHRHARRFHPAESSNLERAAWTGAAETRLSRRRARATAPGAGRRRRGWSRPRFRPCAR